MDRTKLISGQTGKQLLIVVTTVLILSAAAMSAVYLIEKKHQYVLKEALITVLHSMEEAIQIWGQSHRQTIQRLARDKVLTVSASALLQLPRERDALLPSVAQQKLRQLMQPYLDSGQYQGYFLIAPDGTSLASSRAENIGIPNLLMEQPNILAKLWEGNTLLTPVQQSDVALTKADEQRQNNDETMFVGTSINDDSGSIVALLTLRINIHKDLSSLMAQGRLGKSGDSYIFNRRGIMLSYSRFEDQLERIGLLQPEQSSPSNLKLVDPGINLTLPENSRPYSEQQPLTRMAMSAINGEDSYDLKGYRDYRGVPVVGAWSWNQELGLGITIEQNVEEAYDLFHFTCILIYGGAMIAALIIFAFVIVFSKGKKRLRQIQKRLQAIVETAVDGIVVINKFGVIESVNPSIEKLFGYSSTELIGRNVSMLMPEPYHKEHDGYLEHYLNTGERRIIGTGREVEAKRRDDSIFPIELTINRMELDNGLHFAGVIHDISKQKNVEKALLDAKDRLEAATSAGIIGIWEWDVVNNLLVWDKMTYQLYGIRENDFSGAYEAWSSTIHPEDKVRAENYLQETLHGEHEYDAEFRVVWPDGSIHHLKAMSHTTFNEQGEPLYMIGINYDLTEQKKTEHELAKAKIEADEANRAKSTFLATMSHEIRTPLNGVVATVDMLSRTNLEPLQIDLIETARESSLLLQRIIDDILDFSKIEAGKLELDLQPLTLEPLVEKLGESLHHLAGKKGVELLLYCDPNLPQVIGDSVRLRQILYNLAGNAIKFSGNLSEKSGQVMISAVMKGQANGRVALTFAISDNGIGMNDEVQQRLFQPFVQGEYETNRHFGGTGLGLLITKRLVEMMEGTIEVESASGEGSNFTVSLSLESAADPVMPESSSLAGVSTLLLNSNKNVAWILTNYLQHAGADVILTTVDQALEKYREASLTGEVVIIVDGQGEGGDETITSIPEILRHEVQDEGLRLILFERGQRRYARKDDSNRLTLDLNAMRRLTLLNTVAAIVGRESPEIDITTQQVPILQNHILLDETRASGRLILVVDDNGTNRKVIAQQLNMLGFATDLAEDGREALTLWRKNSYAMVMTDCHMPIMDGYQLSETIRSEERRGQRGQHIPIVAITADALKGIDKKCFKSGMDDYLTKPMQLNQMQTMLNRWVTTIPQTIIEEPLPEAADNDMDEIIDPLAMGNLLGTQDPLMLDDYYTDFLKGSRETARQIQEAYQDRAISEVSSLAHKLKSSARTVGANSLADCCLALELAGTAGDTQAVEQNMGNFVSLFESVDQWIVKYHQSYLI